METGLGPPKEPCPPIELGPPKLLGASLGFVLPKLFGALMGPCVSFSSESGPMEPNLPLELDLSSRPGSRPPI